MQVSQLKPGAFYRFSHTGKGEFYAVFRSVEPQADDEDFVAVDIWTGPGSSQERLANSMVHLGGGRKQTPLFSSKLLRPSQIADINAPTSGEQQRLRDSVENSGKDDYRAEEGVTEYVAPSLRKVAAPAPVRSNTAMRYAVPAAVAATALVAVIVKVLA